MKRRRLKQEIFELLAGDDPMKIREGLARYAPMEVVNPLFSALCATSELVRWNAIRAFAMVVPTIANENLESARIVMRRFLWSLNDESGGIGWGAPEAMAEIMVQDERLLGEYLHMLISYTRDDGPELYQDGNYIELPMLQRGLLWGLGRLCSARGRQMKAAGIAEDLKRYLDSPDGAVRGLAIWALIMLGEESARPEVSRLCEDSAELSIYIERKKTKHTVGELAIMYLRTIGKGEGGEF